MIHELTYDCKDQHTDSYYGDHLLIPVEDGLLRTVICRDRLKYMLRLPQEATVNYIYVSNEPFDRAVKVRKTKGLKGYSYEYFFSYNRRKVRRGFIRYSIMQFIESLSPTFYLRVSARKCTSLTK